MRDYDFALHEGPWMIATHHLTVQRWKPNFDLFDDEVKRVAVWIKVLDLPVEYYNRAFLWRLVTY